MGVGNNGGVGDMHPMYPITQNNGEGGELVSAAEVTLHRTRRSSVGADDEVAAANNKLISYWDSPEAAILFGFNYHNKEVVFTGLEERVELLQGVFVKSDGYRDVVANSYEQSLSDYQVFQIRNKCLFLLNELS
jgi:hypothetical protein